MIKEGDDDLIHFLGVGEDPILVCSPVDLKGEMQGGP